MQCSLTFSIMLLIALLAAHTCIETIAIGIQIHHLQKISWYKDSQAPCDFSLTNFLVKRDVYFTRITYGIP